MRAAQGIYGGAVVLALVAATLLDRGALALTTTTRAGSILMFPKVVCAPGRDTVIQLTNTGNMTNDLRCFYLDGDTCSETDFDISLTRLQPTVWGVCAGRPVSPTDAQHGLDPGKIPPLPVGSAGALVCAEVAPGGDVPMARNQVTGEATLVGAGLTGSATSVSKYNAIALPGGSDMDQTLKLDDKEYSACPAAQLLDFPADGSNQTIDALGGTTGAETVTTRVTLVPCVLDFENFTPTAGVMKFDRWDEEELHLSSSRPFSCWDSFALGPYVNPLAGSFGTVQMVGVDRDASPSQAVPVVAVAETFYTDGNGHVTSAAVNLHGAGRCKLPSGELDLRVCTRDADCGVPAILGSCVTNAEGRMTLATP